MDVIKEGIKKLVPELKADRQSEEDASWAILTTDTKPKEAAVEVEIDGKTVKTIKKPTLTLDPGKKDKFTQIMVVNTWNSNANKKCAATSIKKMPKKSMTVTVTGKLK